MSGWSEPAFVEIARLVAKRTGLVFAPNRCESLEHAVRHVMREQGIGNVDEFERKLVSGALPWDALIPRMTVGETYFFRDAWHFAFLKDDLLPELAAIRGPDHRPRVWSAGCATGEEAYSLAIALAEGQKSSGAFVLGTDLSRTALTRARTARYKKWSLRGLDPRLFEKYFRWSADDAVLAPEVKAQVTFQELNLAGSSYPSAATGTFAMDLILCRNVLIYLDADTIANIARRFFDALAPGGVLLAGPSDPLLSEPRFDMEVSSRGVVYRRRSSELVGAPSRAVAELASPMKTARAIAAPSVQPSAEALRTQAEKAAKTGDYESLVELAAAYPGEVWLVVLAMRARTDAAPAHLVEAELRAALARHPLSAELHYLHALTLLEQSRQLEAAEALRRAIYADPGLAIAHFTLGAVLTALRDEVGAERAYRNAQQRSALLPLDEPVPCAVEISARGLAQAAARELELLRNRGLSR